MDQGFQPQQVYGQSNYVYQPMSYQQQYAMQQTMRQQRVQWVEARLRDHYPVRASLAYMALLVLTGLAAITAQVFCFVYGTPYSSAGSGIWGGLCLFGSAGAVAFLRKRTLARYWHF